MLFAANEIISSSLTGSLNIPIATVFCGPSNTLRNLDRIFNCPAVTTKHASPSRHSLIASSIIKDTPSAAVSTNTARGPGKNPIDFKPSKIRDGSFRRSAPEIRVKRISSSAFAPTSDLSSSCLRNPTRIASAP